MSWSVNFIGTPEKVCEALDKHLADMQPGPSADEFGDALAHLKGLVNQNFSKTSPLSFLIHLEANGSGSMITEANKQPEHIYRSCVVSVKQIWTKILI